MNFIRADFGSRGCSGLNKLYYPPGTNTGVHRSLRLIEDVRTPGTQPAHVAQPAEHFLGKEEVTGSSPVVGSRAGEVH